MKAKLTYIPTSVQKLSLVVNLIRNKTIEQAEKNLFMCRKKNSEYVLKTLRSAAANAENNFSVARKDLMVEKVNVGRRAFLKRLDTRAKGSAGRICKPISRMEIILKVREKENGTEG